MRNFITINKAVAVLGAIAWLLAISASIQAKANEGTAASLLLLPALASLAWIAFFPLFIARLWKPAKTLAIIFGIASAS